MKKISRRQFLITSIFLSGSVLSGITYTVLPRKYRPENLFFDPLGASPKSRVLKKVLMESNDIQHSKYIGKLYRQEHLDHDDPVQIAESVFASLPEPHEHYQDTQPLLRALQQLIREDFTHSRTVSVEKWVLSLTECRLCALASF